MSSVFSEQILADKLSKLNNTQQCIETLSHWCIFHRSKAEQVVATWDKQFHSSAMAQKVPLLYLANDILQNSKRKGNEFVAEFWKVLPTALRDVSETGDDRGKNVVARLINIWEERRVFGSRARSLKDLMFERDLPPPLEFGKKRSRSVKIVKRDSRSIRTKLSIGGAAEKIVSAFHLVVSEQANEETEMSNCKSAVNRVRQMEKDVDKAWSNGEEEKQKIFAKELEDTENLLKKSIEKLKSAEASRVALVSQLKDALHEQESELENVRTQMQVALAQAEEACNMRRRLNGEDYVPKSSTAAMLSSDPNVREAQTPKKTAALIAAEVADKLTASSSSQMIMHSVLSSFAAEEAKNAGLTTSSTPSNSVSKPEKPVPVSDSNVFAPAAPSTAPATHSFKPVLLPQPAIQNPSPSSAAPFHMPPQQYLQPSGSMVSYGYSNISPLTPGLPPPPPYMVSPMVPLAQPSQPHQRPMPMAQAQIPISQQQPISLSQQPPGPPGFQPLQPPGMVYYGRPPAH